MGQPSGDDLDRLVVRIVESLDLESACRPVERAGRIEGSLGDIALVVDGHLYAHKRKISSPFMGRWPAGPEGQAERADREEEKIQPESEQQRARQDQDRDGDDADQASSNNVYGRIVERTKATRARASGRCRRVHCMYRHADQPICRAGPSRTAG